MTLDARSADELRTLLLRVAAASADDPARRARAASWFRAALTLVEDEPRPPLPMSTAGARALEELAHSLAMAGTHAEALVEHCASLTPGSPPL